MKTNLSRRDFLKFFFFGSAATAGAVFLKQSGVQATEHGHNSVQAQATPFPMQEHGGGLVPGTVGEVDHENNGFDPTKILTDFDYGEVSTLPNGQTLREYKITVLNKDIEIVPGIIFPAWTYNGRIPGPTLRATEADRIRIHVSNGSNHPHSLHFHGFHAAEMDGVPGSGPGGAIAPGESFTYEFDAEPFGLHLYHCHVFPLARHIAKGLYGAFIVDPKQGRPPVDREMIMVMSGFDVDFDDANDFYAVNAIPFHYQNHPIQIKIGEKIRIYLVNILEFDLINSFHLHANFFHYYPTGTSLTPSEFTDTIIQGQAQRGILEFSYKHRGMFMFHAHVTEFAELGWNGMFEVTE
ncbi:MAG: multicopper oxidase domain-containing protein [Chloroflexi bacterium]|nr:multicopper oxidase domain-containing protein [Chloroflexota bacterium]